jgi:hypothetical protein
VIDLSVCLVVKERSKTDTGEGVRYYLPNTIRSIALSLLPGDSVEIVVVDWHSTDWPLAEWIHPMAVPATVKLVEMDGPFSVGRGKNYAVDVATKPILLLMEGDVIVDREAILTGCAAAARGLTYFANIWWWTNPSHTEGAFLGGLGTAFVSRDVFNRTGGFPEYGSHGMCDVTWHRRVDAIAPCVIENVRSIQHLWHPRTEEWLNRHYPPGWQEDDRAKLAKYYAGTLE